MVTINAARYVQMLETFSNARDISFYLKMRKKGDIIGFSKTAQ